MRAPQVGDIVVVMESCYEDCGICAALIGSTAVVVSEDALYRRVALTFEGEAEAIVGFEPFQLYVTGLTA